MYFLLNRKFRNGQFRNERFGTANINIVFIKTKAFTILFDNNLILTAAEIKI